MRITDIPEISSLSTAEKILLVEELWDSISARDNILVPESHKTELERRFIKYQKRRNRLLSLKELQTRIEKRK